MIRKSLLLLFASISLCTYAQEVEEKTEPESVKEKKEKPSQTSEFKPESGAISIDFTANELFKTFGGGPQFQLSDDAQGFGGGIRVRYFLSPELAVRINLFTNHSTYYGSPVVTDAADGLDESDAATATHQQQLGHYSLSIGAEKHFSGTERLDTYVGGELLGDYVHISEDFKNVDENGNFVSGYTASSTGALKGQSAVNLNNKTDVRNSAGYAFGLRLCTGADFYVLPKLYIGAELGIAAMYKIIDDYTMQEVDPRNGKSTPLTITDRGQAFYVGQDITAQFRIGFTL